MAIVLFIAKLVLGTGLLYGYYHLFLRNQRFHHYNRFYLLAIALISVIIPFINIPVNLFGGGGQHPALIQTLKVININGWEEPVTIYGRRGLWASWVNLQTGLWLMYIAGLLTGVIAVSRSFVYIHQLRKKYPYQAIDRLKIYQTREPGAPFSFFRSIFWDRSVALDGFQGQQIFRHELFHVKEKHSADILLMELLCCIVWFNPFFHLIKKEIKAIHEFLADEYAVSASNRYEYAELLVVHAIRQKTPSLTHPFFHNQIKRRITMITQSNLARRSGYISRIMALPLLFVLVSAFAVKLTNHRPPAANSKYAGKNITVVIDAGHGGIFEGSHNSDGIKEKDINLAIAKKIHALAASFNITVILTRNNDQTVGNTADLKEDLQNRISIANESKADLLLSIHINAGVDNKLRSGFEAYISRKNQNPGNREFASALLGSVKSIYAVNETIQQRDEGIVVIDRPTCPAVLMECGNIDDPKDLAFITNPANQEAVARKILEGIVQYSNIQTGNVRASVNNLAKNDTIINVSLAAQQNNNTTEIIDIKLIEGDTISAEALSRLNPDKIKSLNVDLPNDLITVYLKNGSVKYAHAKQVNDYYTANHLDGELTGYRTNITMKDSVVDINFTKDTVPTGSKGKDIVFTKVEFEAGYPGGQQGWIDYLKSHLHYPDAAQKKNIQGTVLMEFIVNTDGTITDVKAIRGPELLKAQSIKVIKESGVWIPAQQNGKKVKAYKRQPITYKLA
jgi:TonB family protein